MREMSDMEWLETIRKSVEGSATDITEKMEKLIAVVSAAEAREDS
jgi:hypothetical protein